MSLKRWWEVYPQGTREGDEETRFFIALCRKPEFRFRSVDELSLESGLTKVRVEELIQKYVSLGMISASPSDPDMWGYWERVGKPQVVSKTITEEDHEIRVKKCGKSRHQP